MTWTQNRAGGQLLLAEQLLERLPAVFAALDAGDLDVPKAMVFADETINLDQQVARRVVDHILGQAPTLTTGQLRVRLRKLVLAVDPDGIRKAATERVRERRVVARLSFDGLAELAGYDLPPHRVAAAMERLTAIARAAKSAGDGRKVDQLRADAMLDLLVGDGTATGGPITRPTLATPEPGPAPTPTAEPVEAGDDALDPDHEELAGLWAAGFGQLPTSRPQQTPRGAMPAPRKGVVDLQIPLTTWSASPTSPGSWPGGGR